MSRQLAQLATRIKEEKSVTTKEFPAATEMAKDLKKSYCDRVFSVATGLTSGKANVCYDKENYVATNSKITRT